MVWLYHLSCQLWVAICIVLINSQLAWIHAPGWQRMNHHHNTAKCSVGGYESKWLGIRNFVDCNIIKAKNLAFRSKLLQQVGIVAPDDDIPIVTGLSTFKVSPWKLFTKLMDGDLAELAGEPLFLLLDQFYRRFGPVYRIVFGPKSFLVITDPIAIRHILRTNAFNYNKGVLKEVLDPVMGEGLISADVDVWRAKKRVIAPGITKQWINSLIPVFSSCNRELLLKLSTLASRNASVDMETEFGSVSLDAIGKAVFGFAFHSVASTSPVVNSVYRILKEAEHRSMSLLPYWKLPSCLHRYIPRIRDYETSRTILNTVLDGLIFKTRQDSSLGALPSNRSSSLLHYLLHRMETPILRDDLMTVLVAGHETTAALLTWSLFNIILRHPIASKVINEVDQWYKIHPDPTNVTFEDIHKMKYLKACLIETLRLYPQPPLLIRRAIHDDYVPIRRGEFNSSSSTDLDSNIYEANHSYIKVRKGEDVFLSTYSLHHSPLLYANPHVFDPDRHIIRDHGRGYYDEVCSEFEMLPFGGGPRRCMGDQFALTESLLTLSTLLRHLEFSFEHSPESVGMKTGATIHTSNGLWMKVKHRSHEPVQ